MQLRRRPTKRELAAEIVTKGFHRLSREHHPDRNGDNETQQALTLARDYLNEALQGIEEDYPENAVVIEEPLIEGITDDDIPF
jgi:hypothetical protein